MKTNELIKKLLLFPPDTEVYTQFESQLGVLEDYEVYSSEKLGSLIVVIGE